MSDKNDTGMSAEDLKAMFAGLGGAKSREERNTDERKFLTDGDYLLTMERFFCGKSDKKRNTYFAGVECKVTKVLEGLDYEDPRKSDGSRLQSIPEGEDVKILSTWQITVDADTMEKVPNSDKDAANLGRLKDLIHALVLASNPESEICAADIEPAHAAILGQHPESVKGLQVIYSQRTVTARSGAVYPDISYALPSA